MVSSLQTNALVQHGRVHRAVYTDPDIFELEQKRVFERAWIYVGHESELPKPGDYILGQLGTQEIILVRQADGTLTGLENRCLHRGAQLAVEKKGNVRQFICAYHAWAFGLDGALLAVPLPEGYSADSGCAKSGQSLQRIRKVESYRGFIFASNSDVSPTLKDFLGGLASALDNMVDRAPSGALVHDGGKLHMEYRGNWKLFMENAVDLVHPMFVHGAAVMAARKHSGWANVPGTTGQTTQMLLANGLKLGEWDNVEIHAHDGGHVFMGGFYRDGVIASQPQDPLFNSYWQALESRHGTTRAREVLSVDRFNNLIWPTLSVNTRFQTVRVVQPLAVDRTIISSYCFRLVGAPSEMFDLGLRFLNTASSPASLVASDDLEIFERCQQGLSRGLSDWIDISRGQSQDTQAGPKHWQGKGTSELSIRHQLAAWQHWMSLPEEAAK